VHTPGANTQAVVELVWALVFDALRPRVFLDKPLARGKWEELRGELLADRGVSERTLGVWGLGRVGSRVAAVGRALGMRVVYHDVREIPEAERQGAAPVSADELCESADVLSVHVDGRAANRGMIGAAQLARMRPDVVLVNTSRGMVIDPFALAGFMIAHPGAQALLDVHEPEPFDARYPLLDIPNVHLTPHIGAATRTAKRNMSWVVKDVWRELEAARAGVRG
jgi:phosphoglycerate dehydrogenase-like enzyme